MNIQVSSISFPILLGVLSLTIGLSTHSRAQETIPVAPQGVTATAGRSQVTLNWDNPNNYDITSYQIRWWGDNGKYRVWTKIPGSDKDTTSYTVRGLISGVRHSFYIRAIADGYAIGESSSRVTATPTAPVAPQGVTATAERSQVKLNWDNPNDSDITSYQIRLWGDNGEYRVWTKIPGSDKDTTSYTVRGLINGVRYSFYIRAIVEGDAIGIGEESSRVTATPTIPTTSPGAPQGVTATADMSNVKLNWDNPNNPRITKYQVRWWGDNGKYKIWTDIPGSNKDTTDYTVKYLPNDVRYSFYIRVIVDGDVIGEESSRVTATPAETPTPGPTPAPQGFTATAGISQVTLKWDNPNNPNITEYQVKRWTPYNQAYKAWTKMPNSGADTVLYTERFLRNGTLYRFQVRAVVGNIPGQESAIITVTPGDQVPSSPANLTVTPGDRAPGSPAHLTGTPGDGQVELSWSNPNNPNITKYQFKWWGHNGKDKAWTDIPGSDKDTTDYTVSGLTNGVSHDFYIRAIVGEVVGEESSRITVMPTTGVPELAPGAPQGVTATPGISQVTLSWDNPNNPNITEYQVKRWTPISGAYKDWTNMPGSDKDTTDYTERFLRNRTLYRFQVRAMAGNVEGKPSVVITGIPGPGRPSNLTGIPGDGKVELSWSNPSNPNITKYEVRWWGYNNKYKDWTDIPNSDKDTTSYTVIGLTNGVSHNLYIRAIVGDIVGDSSSRITVMPTTGVPELAPGAPQGVKATAGISQVTLSWDKPNNTNITKYQVRWWGYNNKYMVWTDIPNSDKDTTSYTVIGLTNGVSHNLYIRAIVGDIVGDSSLRVTATPEDPHNTDTIEAPEKPQALTATVGDGEVNLSWDDPLNSDITKYQFKWWVPTDTSKYRVWTDIPNSGQFTDSYTVSGLTNEVEHYFRIRAIAGNVLGAQTDPVTATPEDPHNRIEFNDTDTIEAPGAPANLTTTVGDGEVNLSWNDPLNSDITKYQFKWWVPTDTSKSSDWTDIPNSGQFTDSYTVSGLTNEVEHHFQIRAIAGNIVGTPSDPVIATPEDPHNIIEFNDAEGSAVKQGGDDYDNKDTTSTSQKIVLEKGRTYKFSKAETTLFDPTSDSALSSIGRGEKEEGKSALLEIPNGVKIKIEGNGAIIERDADLGCDDDSAKKFRIFSVAEGGILYIENATIRGGCVEGGGGAILNRGELELKGVTLRDNKASENGGAIKNVEGGIVTLSSTTITNNFASSGGGIYNDGCSTVNVEGMDTSIEENEGGDCEGCDSESCGGGRGCSLIGAEGKGEGAGVLALLLLLVALIPAVRICSRLRVGSSNSPLF